MELESVQLETTWNDAASVINTNSQKIKAEIEKIKGASLEGGYGEFNVQSDWNETDETSDAYIKNKPTIPSGSNIYIAKTTLWDLEDAYRQGTDYYFPEEDLQAFADSMKNGTTVLFPDPFGMGAEYQYRGYGMLVAAAVEDMLYLSIADQYGKTWGLDIVWGDDSVSKYGKLESISQRYVDYDSLKTINGQTIYGSGDIETAKKPYTIQSLKIEDISVGASFENEIGYIKDAIRSGDDIEIRALAGGKSKAIFQDLDDFVYLSFPRTTDIIFLEADPATGEIVSGYVTTSTSL